MAARNTGSRKAKAKPAAKAKAVPKKAKATRKKSAPKAKAAKKKPTLPRSQTPKGPRLTAAKQSLRDDLMLARVASGWTIGEAAAEAGIAVSTAKKALALRRKARPNLLDMDPVEIIRHIIEGLQSSIGTFELMANTYAESNPNAAVGAKKAANGARQEIMSVLQSTGTLPHELGTLRHLVDVRAVAVAIIDAVQKFEGAVEALEIDDDTRTQVREAAGGVRAELELLAGGLSEPEGESDGEDDDEAV